LASSFFSSAFSGIGAASLEGSLGVAGGAGSAGAAGAGGGGGGAGSSFLPHPTNVRVKAKSAIADNGINFFPILNSPPFPSHFEKLFLLMNWYRTSLMDIQGRTTPTLPMKTRPSSHGIAGCTSSISWCAAPIFCQQTSSANVLANFDTHKRADSWPIKSRLTEDRQERVAEKLSDSAPRGRRSHFSSGKNSHQMFITC
jgi:hypothetical protein